jgi:toxin ParE1/3/4
VRVEITARAKRDLVAIGEFIATDNEARAATFVEELLEKCWSLGEYPRRYPVVGRYEGNSVRRCGHDGYGIFYTVREAVVTVLHVLHGARDYEALLPPS